MAGKEKNTLDKVKRDFLRITSPCEYGGNGRHFDSIRSVNVPPLLARAGAFFDGACAILRQELKTPSAKRSGTDAWQSARRLLQGSQLSAGEAVRCAKAEKQEIPAGPFLDHLRLLLDTLDALIPLAGLRAAAGSAGIFRKGEEEIRGFLLKTLEGPPEDVRCFLECFQAKLSKADAERYAKAYAEYTAFCRKPAGA